MVCDTLDQCPGYPDYLDSDNDGIPDCEEDEISMDCEPEDIPYCKFLEQLLNDIECHQGENPKIMFNNLIAMNDYLKGKLVNNEAMLQYLPFPILKKQLENQSVNDADNDGIVNILDPAPDKEAYKEGEGQLSGTHDFSDQDFIDNSIILCEWDPEEGYARERAQLLNMFLYTVNPGVLVGTNPDDSNNPVVSGCYIELKGTYELDETDYNEAGHFYSGLEKCYVYFELDCSCNCIVKNTQAINLVDERCVDVVIGDECTQDPAFAETDGYHYVECPPANADPCIIYGIVSNPNYDPYDPGDEVPCTCEQQMLPNGEPSETIDSDGDGTCDLIDQCWPARDDEGILILEEFDDYGAPNEGYIPYQEIDSDGDGIMDCFDKCDGVIFADTQDEADEILLAYSKDDNDDNDNTEVLVATKEGYATPTGPGDVCDDGNSCTYDDVITQDCECLGVYIDSDDDGVYDCEECELGPGVIENVALVINGVVQEDEDGNTIMVEKEIFGFGQITVFVDYIGNETDEGADDARTLINCDVCPGIPDGDPLDLGGQYPGDLPMDYNDNGLPDCIDPPFKPICPVDWKIVEGIGLVLIFDTDNLSEGDYPEPINFQGKVNNGPFVNWEYLIIDFSRELEDGTTEVIYPLGQYGSQTYDFDIASIVYSDHQQCSLTDTEIVPLICPSDIFVSETSDVKRLSFDLPINGDFDLNEMFGTYVINGVEIELSGFYEDGGSVDVILPEEFDLQDPFSGTIILPSGQECVYENGIQESCDFTDSDGNIFSVNPGDPCDDNNECTHHDKYVTNMDGDCECIGVEKPDSDGDTLCDEIDPCPEEPNELDAAGNPISDSCPCDILELTTGMDQNPLIENESDFYLYVSNDMSGYENISVVINDGQNNPIELSLGATSPIVISNLTGGYVYTITITANCPNSNPQSLTFTVDVPFGDSPILCGVSLDPVDLSTYTLLPSLSGGEDFTASDFVVSVKEATGGYGKFSGNGYISIPYFNAARLNLKFKDITISNNRQLIDGYLEIDGFGLALLGDELSDAINGSLDVIISTLEDINEILEELIPMLENIEALLETTSHLVDPAIVNCIKLHEATLIGLKNTLETNENLTDAEKDVIKQQIKTVSGLLQDCIDQYNAELAAILGALTKFVPWAIQELRESCDPDAEITNVENFNLDNSDLIVTPTELEVILNGMIDGNPEGDQSIPMFENVYSFDYALIEPYEETSDNDMILEYYQKESNRDFCILMDQLTIKINDSTNPLSLEEIKVMLKVLSNMSEETINKISVKVKEKTDIDPLFNDWQQIYPDLEEDIKMAFKKAIVQYLYKN